MITLDDALRGIWEFLDGLPEPYSDAAWNHMQRLESVWPAQPQGTGSSGNHNTGGEMIPNDVRRDIADCVALAKEWRKTWDASRRVEAWLDSQPVAPEPDWDSAPEWAQVHFYSAMGWPKWSSSAMLRVATNAPGGWECWERNSSVRIEFANGKQLPIGIDWRTTLRRSCAS